MRKIIQRLTIQEESRNRIDTKDMQDLSKIICKELLAITREVIIPQALWVTQKGYYINTRLHGRGDPSA